MGKRGQWTIAFCMLMVFPGLHGPCYAQGGETYYFERGLLANAGTRYGREALYLDPLAWQLYNHSLARPAEGGEFGKNAKGQPILWQALSADSLHRFRVRGSGGGGGFGAGAGGSYVYFSYTADREKIALLNIRGNGGLFFNGTPHAGDPYGSGWLYIPVRLKKGLNELYVRPAGQFVASLVFTDKPVQLNTEDPTIPVIPAGAAGNDSLYGAVVLINNTREAARNYRLSASLEGHESVTEIPVIPGMSSRKISFLFNGSAIRTKGHYDCLLRLLDKGKLVEERKLALEAAGPGEQYSVTFRSGIDGSLQYYAVTPQSMEPLSGASSGKEASTAAVSESAPAGTVFAQGAAPGKNLIPVSRTITARGPALFLSVHGAGVEAIGQARAYQPKGWGTLVAATNRRPRGFNWEDWGRLDAMEVLSLAKERFNPDPQRIYLTGHSMGGHGTWFLGATYPGKWAAIGACSGYPTLKDYGSHDGVVPDSGQSKMEEMLIRASDQSDVIKLAANYKAMGVYILHGDSDKVVPVKYARQMRKVLADFHTDMCYHEVAGAEHWYGNQSVDWKPLFDFFKWHERKPDSLVDQIDFMTASPGISDGDYWVSIRQQQHPLCYSHIQLNRNRSLRSIMGTTENIRMLNLSLAGFAANDTVTIVLDGLNPVVYTTTSGQDSLLLLRENEGWKTAASPGMYAKGPQRYGTLKDAFNHHMVFVYGTAGNREENEWSRAKARYDAETWYYRGNGAVDIVSDKEFSLSAYAGRGVILFGNASTNSVWDLLLKDCPIRVERGRVKAGGQVWEGDGWGAYFVWPLRNSPLASVAVIGGSGLKGMEAANANQYFAGASGFPDYMIFGIDMLQSGSGSIKLAGFFDNDWRLSTSESAKNP